jgi:alpha-glucosidase
MQWTKGKNAGFSVGTPWLPVHEEFASECVETGAKEEDSVLSYYRRLADLRQHGEAAGVLIQGDYEELLKDNSSLMAFKRSFGCREVYTVVNFTGEEQEYELPGLDTASLEMASLEESSKGLLRPFEAQIYIRETC